MGLFAKLFLLTALSFCIASACFDSPGNPTWNAGNCKDGTVTDYVCCKDKHCPLIENETGCNAEMTCHWKWNKDKTQGKCKKNRDHKNNVCCKSHVSETCDKITQGKCPSDFITPRRCCSYKSLKYDHVLKLDFEGKDVRNTGWNKSN